MIFYSRHLNFIFNALTLFSNWYSRFTHNTSTIILNILTLLLKCNKKKKKSFFRYINILMPDFDRKVVAFCPTYACTESSTLFSTLLFLTFWFFFLNSWIFFLIFIPLCLALRLNIWHYFSTLFSTFQLYSRMQNFKRISALSIFLLCLAPIVFQRPQYIHHICHEVN